MAAGVAAAAYSAGRRPRASRPDSNPPGSEVKEGRGIVALEPDVKAVLLEHPAVAEAGVIGKPDPVALEIVKAFVALKPGIEATDDLRRELLAFARVRLGAAVAPKEIDFRPSIPKNRAGKIMRRLLRARELGLPEGDISTLVVS